MEMDELLLMDGGADVERSSQQLLYMHEEVKKNTTAAFLVNYSMSAGSEAPINSIVTADDLIDDGHGFDDMHQ